MPSLCVTALGWVRSHIHVLLNVSAQSSASCSPFLQHPGGLAAPATIKPTIISTRAASCDAAPGQPLDGYTQITGETRAALALPTWHPTKCLQSHPPYFSAPRTLQVLVGCVRSLLSCNSFRQYPKTGREMEREGFASWHNCKISISAGRRGAVGSQQQHQPFTSISWPNQTSDR